MGKKKVAAIAGGVAAGVLVGGLGGYALWQVFKRNFVGVPVHRPAPLDLLVKKLRLRRWPVGRGLMLNHQAECVTVSVGDDSLTFALNGRMQPVMIAAVVGGVSLVELPRQLTRPELKYRAYQAWRHGWQPPDMVTQ